MLTTLADLHIRVRDRVFEMAGPDDLFAFDIVESVDASQNGAGELFQQNEDFWLFEVDIDDVRRAGPSVVSPRRGWATLSISLLTKKRGQGVPALLRLEAVSDWFRDRTINDIRFRTFTPVSPAWINGFTSYSGVINCDFELQ